MPLLSYYDYFGALVPYDLSHESIRVFPEFTETSASYLNGDKSLWGRTLQLLGLTGQLPHISNGVILSILLPGGKILLLGSTYSRHYC